MTDDDVLCAGCGERPALEETIYCESCVGLAESYPDEDPEYDPEDEDGEG